VWRCGAAAHAALPRTVHRRGVHGAAAVPRTADVVIAGTGVCGLATAHYLAQRDPRVRIVLVSPHPVMGLTSQMSSECFRDHWPAPGMRLLMGTSIRLLADFAAQHEAAGGAPFSMSKRGYLYVSTAPSGPANLLGDAAACHPPHQVHRIHGGSAAVTHGARLPTVGATVYADGPAVAAACPWLTGDAAAAMHVHNAGWLSAHAMGMAMWDGLMARTDAATGEPLTTYVRGRVAGIATRGAHPEVAGVSLQLAGQEAGPPAHIAAPRFVNAAGPFLNAVHRRHFQPLPDAGAAGWADGPSPHDLPLFSEVHAKAVVRDPLGILPRDSPMTICADPVTVPWTEEELRFFDESLPAPLAAKMRAPLAPGVHYRPYGSDAVLMLGEGWHHGLRGGDPPAADVAPVLDHEWYGQVLVRALSRIVPDLSAYFDEAGWAAWVARAGKGRAGSHTVVPDSQPGVRCTVDGGYYTKTAENVPLVGLAPGRRGEGTVAGSFVVGAVSGYGIMACHGVGAVAADLVAASHSGVAEAPWRPIEAADSVDAALPERLRRLAAFLTPLRHQQPAFTGPGGGRDQLLAAGGGQL
jgi:sarcosine oxidase, subunit beta